MGTNEDLILHGGEVELSLLKRTLGTIEKAVVTKSGNMTMSGYVSTLDPDLEGQVILPQAFAKFLQAYKNNPIYCYNHDKHIPIGKVTKMSLDEKGFYFDEIQLTPHPLVKDVLWLLIEDKVLRQQSIGALPVDGEYRKGLYYHTLLYPIEGSLVSVAANPQAELDAIKSLGYCTDKFCSIDSLVKGFNAGMVNSDDRRKVFSLSGTETFVDNTEEEKMLNEETPTASTAFTPDFSDVKAVVLAEEQKSLYDPEGTVISKPTKLHKNFDKYNVLVHAGVKQVNGGSVYMFEIGEPTSKGFKYNYEKSIVSLARILGIKGSAVYDVTEKAAIIERISEAFVELGKEEHIPMYKGIPVNQVDWTAVEDVKYSDVTWKDEDKVTIDKALLSIDLENISNTVKSYSGAEMPEDIKMLLKSFYASVSIYGTIWNAEDAASLDALFEIIFPTEPSVDTPLDPSVSMMNSNLGCSLEEKEALLKALADYKNSSN